MCGIFGVVYRDPQQPVDTDRLAAARDTLTHRGPDEAGLWSPPQGGVGLAHRRLSILDLEHGQQPWVSGDEQQALVYNGEVYNYRDLMRQAESQGATFNTTCDTELVFHTLATQGIAGLDQLHGMFALGFYDHAERSLLLVRDRLGQKPLYWTDTGDAMVFASELKAILSYTQAKYDLDAAAVEQFFTRGYVLSPRTIFQGIHKLPAGHWLKLDANNWQMQIEPWWDATPMSSEELGPLSDEHVLDTLDELLSQSVSDRLIADVPIGTLLSGGIDSSLITAMASKVRSSSGVGEPVKAFTIGFGDSPAHDETPYAKMVAEQYGCDWHCETINQSEGDWLSELEDASRFYDEPFGNFTVTSQRTLSRLCREQLTVVLSGQGGDELSAGYPGRYNWVLQTEQAASSGNALSQYAPPVDDVVHHLQRSSFLQWQGTRALMFSADAQAQMQAGQSPIDCIKPYWQRHNWPDRLSNVLYTDSKTNLADYLVCIEERASMSHSLEARNPMLDHRVVQYMLSLPEQYKARPGTGPMTKDGIQNKWLLHALSKRYLPSEAFDRPKRGFTPPLQQWMATYAQRITEVFRETDALTAPLYSNQWRQYLLNGRYEAGATMAVYYSLVFALWARRYADHIGGMVGDEPSTKRERVTELPTDGSLANASCSDKAVDYLLHRAYRTNEPEAVATGRWFCQALRNFDAGSTVQLIGDDEQAYRWLTEQSGLHLATDEQAGGTVVIGLNALRSFDASQVAGQTLLLFVPFRVAEQGELNTLLQGVAATHPVQGHQAVPVGGDQGVLIARCINSSA